MFSIVPLALLLQVSNALTIYKEETCIDDKQLELKKGGYKPELSMLAYWDGKFSTASTINELDTKNTCLVSFTKQQLDSCKQGAWMCIWQKRFDDKPVARNTNITEPGWSDDKPSHCHGGGWGKKDDSDVSWKFRYENFNRVVCKDHGFGRGYHTGVQKPDGNYHWSCGCVEDMPQVSRCDCTHPLRNSTEKYVVAGCKDLSAFIKQKNGIVLSNPNNDTKNPGMFGYANPLGPLQAPINKNQYCGLATSSDTTDFPPSPATTTVAEKPATTTVAEKPATTTVSEKPATTTVAEKPATTTVAEKPATTTVAEKPATTTDVVTSCEEYDPITDVVVSSALRFSLIPEVLILGFLTL